MRVRRTTVAVTNEEWATQARSALGSISGAIEDIIRPYEQRELGPAVFRRVVAEGLFSLRALIENTPTVSTSANSSVAKKKKTAQPAARRARTR